MHDDSTFLKYMFLISFKIVNYTVSCYVIYELNFNLKLMIFATVNYIKIWTKLHRPVQCFGKDKTLGKSPPTFSVSFFFFSLLHVSYLFST